MTVVLPTGHFEEGSTCILQMSLFCTCVYQNTQTLIYPNLNLDPTPKGCIPDSGLRGLVWCKI